MRGRVSTQIRSADDRQQRLAEAFARVAKEVNAGTYGEVTLKMEAGRIVRAVWTRNERIEVGADAESSKESQ